MFSFVPWELLDLSYQLWQCVPSSKIIWFDKTVSFTASELANIHFQCLFHCPYVSNRGRVALSLFSATSHDLGIGMASKDRTIVMVTELSKILAPASASTRAMYLLEMLSRGDFLYCMVFKAGKNRNKKEGSYALSPHPITLQLCHASS